MRLRYFLTMVDGVPVKTLQFYDGTKSWAEWEDVPIVGKSADLIEYKEKIKNEKTKQIPEQED
jgi:hypothetical protein